MAKKQKQDDVTAQITAQAEDVYNRIRRKQKPQMKLPVRSLSNVRYRPAGGFFQLGMKNKVRTLTVSTVKTFAQTLKMLAMSRPK